MSRPTSVRRSAANRSGAGGHTPRARRPPPRLASSRARGSSVARRAQARGTPHTRHVSRSRLSRVSSLVSTPCVVTRVFVIVSRDGRCQLPLVPARASCQSAAWAAGAACLALTSLSTTRYFPYAYRTVITDSNRSNPVALIRPVRLVTRDTSRCTPEHRTAPRRSPLSGLPHPLRRARPCRVWRTAFYKSCSCIVTALSCELTRTRNSYHGTYR